ncbi:MAG: type II secretion system F family protein [Firmicutes bacterium]|nr:type II secretion system F family protein [Bacillota bacterium]
MRDFIEFCKGKKLVLVIILLVALSSMIPLYISTKSMDEAFLLEGEKIVGVQGEAAEKGISISVEAISGEASVERDVVLKKASKGGEATVTKYELSPEDMMETEISKLTRTINQSQGDVLILPQQLGDDMTLSWKRNDNRMTWLLPMIFPPLILIFMYRGERDEIKQKDRREAEYIVSELPSFNNKLVLLLGSGLVYEESLRRIAASVVEGESYVLPQKIKEVVKEAENTNKDATKILNEYARQKKISELKRVTTIIMDNQKMGTDLRSKLVLEGELLWDKRKKRAEELGKIAESKLTLPLGIMLISLLVVTAGPAMMQM